MEAAPTCFGLQRNHRQGATASAYLKLQDWFSVDIDVQTSVLWRHSMTCVACVLHLHSAQHTRHSTDVCTTSISTLDQPCNFS